MRNLLVVAEVALSLLLLVGSGLLINSFLQLRKSDLGFDPTSVLTMRLSLPVARYKDDAQVLNFYERLLQRAQGIPGARSAGLSVGLPMDGGIESSFAIEGQAPPEADGLDVAVNLAVTEGYFSAMNIRLMRGRFFSATDRKDAPAVAIVDEMLVERYFPNVDPIGKRIKAGVDDSSPWRQIVGIVKHVKHYGPDEQGRPEIYVPYWQMSATSGMQLARSMMLVIGSGNEPGALTNAVRAEVRQIDKDQPVSQVRMMQEIVASIIAPQRFATWLLGLFAASAMVLAIVGVYSVTAYTVSQRTQEIGIRMALGARPQDVFKLFVGQGMKAVLIGLALGLACAFFLTQAMANLLYGVGATRYSDLYPSHFSLIRGGLAGLFPRLT